MDRSGDEASVEAGDALGCVQVRQRAPSASNHAVLLLADDKDSGDLERVREHDGSQGEASVHRHPLVAEGLGQEGGHEERVAEEGCRVAQSDELRQVGAPVGHDLAVGWLGKARCVVDCLSQSHDRVQWLAESRADQEVDPCNIELVSSEVLIDKTHSDERKDAPESSILEETSLIHSDEFTAEVLATLFIELVVEDAVCLRNVEWVRDEWIEGHIVCLSSKYSN